MQITPITRPDDLDQVGEEWRTLEGRRQPRNPFLSWEFMSLWWRHYGLPPGHELFVLTGYEQARLVGVAPLYLRNESRSGSDTHCLCFIGDNVIAPDFLDSITAPGYAEPFMMAAARYLQGRCRHTRIELNGIAEDVVRGPAWQSFRRQLGLETEYLDTCPWMKLPADYTTYSRSLSPRWRRSVERKRRRLAKHCPYRFEAFTGREAVGNLERFARLNEQRLLDRELDGGFVDQGFRAFHRDLAAALAPLDMIELHFLRADSGEDIAGGYFLKDPDSKRYYYYQQGFARQFGIYSPGNILTARSIEFAINQRAVEFHFLKGPEPYKYRWTGDSRTLLSVHGFNQGLSA